MAVWLRHRSSPTCSGEELLARHPELREVLDPLVEAAEQDEVPGDALRDLPPCDASVAGAATERIFGSYRLRDEIGRGGVGVVYEALQQPLGRRVAVKMLAEDLQHHPQAVARFRRESELLARLRHAHIVPVFDAGLVDGVPFHAMERIDGAALHDVLLRLRGQDAQQCDGRSLATALREELHESAGVGDSGVGDGRIGEQLHGRSHAEVSVRLVHAIATALCAAHEQGILHRDVKPENCMRISRTDNPNFVKVLDFGLAKMLMAEPGLDVSLSAKGGGIMGTPEYMSPERIRGLDLDARTDVYALGVLAYELVTGCVPYSGDHYTKVLDQQLNAAPVPPRKVSPNLDISRGVEVVILRALEKSREARFSSAGEMADAFEQVDAGMTTSSGADSESASHEGTYRAIIVVLVLLVFVLSAVVLGQTFGWF